MKFGNLLVIVVATIYTSLASADINWKEYPSSTENLMCNSFIPIIHGDIGKDDVKKLSGYLSEVQKRLGRERWSDCKHSGPYGIGGMVIWLNSRGGEIDAAIEIGKILRLNNMTAVVGRDAECSSSCVLILGGAVVRNAFGKIGVHRPYFGSVSPTTNYSLLREKREDMLEKIRDYLREVDVSLMLVEMMEGTPPERIRYLTDAEMNEVRLHGEDAAFNERTTAEEALIWGISSLQYRQRVSEGNSKCAGKPLEEGDLCLVSILLGGTNGDAARYEKYWTNCLKGHGYNSKKTVRECRTGAVQRVKSGL